MIQVCGVESEGGDEAVHAFVEEVMCVGGFLAIGLGGVADDEVVAGLGHDFFDAGEDGAYELAFKLVDDDADGVGLLHPEVAGEAVGAVAHFPGGVHDALPCFTIDSGMVLQAPADCGGRKAEDLCDIVDGDVFFSRHKSSVRVGVKVSFLKKFMQSVTM